MYVIVMLCCLQVGFDHSDGLFKLVPMLAEHRDPPTHLAGLHILASFIYSRGRSQDTMAKQLKEAGLYDAALILLKVHSHVIGQNQSAAHQDTLEWLEASQTDSPMASLPEDHPLDAELGDRPALTVGNTSQPKGNDSAADLAFQTDSGTPSGHGQLTTAQTVPLPNARPRTPPKFFRARRIGGGSFPPEMSEGTLDHAIDDASRQLMEEDAERLSGDVTLADQVVLAALEVLFKLSASQQHLQFFRCVKFPFSSRLESYCSLTAATLRFSPAHQSKMASSACDSRSSCCAGLFTKPKMHHNVMVMKMTLILAVTVLMVMAVQYLKHCELQYDMSYLL